MASTRPRWLAIAGIAVLLFLVWPAWVGFYTDWLWFSEVGYRTVFSRSLTAKLLLGVSGGATAFLLTWLNLRLAQRLSIELPDAESHITFNEERVAMPNFGRLSRRLILPVSILVGLFFGSAAWDHWEAALQFLHQTPFGEADPIFGRDIGFYFFTLPLLGFVSAQLAALVVIGLIGAAALYVARQSILLGGGGLAIERGARTHLLVLLAALFAVLSWGAYLDRFDLLYSTRGHVAGMSYADHTAALPMLTLRTVAALLAAALTIASARRSRNRLVWAGVGLYFAALLIGGGLYPSLVQRFSVAPNELAKETPYIVNNIAATRKAFNLDRVEERELTSDQPLTAADIQANRRTINSIRLWDQGPLLSAFGQIQAFRTYYNFQAVDNDRYRINDELRQVMISAREISTESLPSRNWINERLTYTHGFGLTLGPVNQATTGGLPVLFVKDIPPAASEPRLKVDRPEIYYGEVADEHVYVRTKTEEFNYPSGAQDVFARYDGEGGVGIGSSWRKTLFATRFGDMKLLLSNEITPESRVLFHRRIKDRLEKVAPFLRFDPDPYLVISEGRLFWICDAYTVSDRYPYSQPAGGINYIRNSVKAVVDAYHGHVRLYVADEADPLIRTYARIFPGTLRPLSEMSADLRAHLRYPEYIFSLQTAVYSTYHMDQPRVLYNKEDQWAVAAVSEAQGQAQTMEPYYTVMQLPGEAAAEFLLMLPFTPRGKDNLAAWMVARADGENYGRLLVYSSPKQKVTFGPKQVVQLINQDAEISRQLSLWNQRGSRVIPGTLLVIPIEQSLIYVQPLYLQAEGGKIPELKRVIVVAENRPIAMEETLEASLARVFGGAPPPAPAPEEALAQAAPPPPPATPGAPGGLAAQARGHYDRAIQAQREGDWARYGDEIKRLGAVLEQMSRAQ